MYNIYTHGFFLEEYSSTICMFDRPNEAEPVSRFSPNTSSIVSNADSSVQLRRAAGTWYPGFCDTNDTSFASSSDDNKNISLAKGGSPVKSTSCNFPQTVLEKSLVSNKPIPTSISDSALTKKNKW